MKKFLRKIYYKTVFKVNSKYIAEIKKYKRIKQRAAYKEMIEAVRKYGISKDTYVKEKFYLLKPASLDKYYAKESVKAKVDDISEKFDAPKGLVYQTILDTYAKYKISIAYFVANDLYADTSDENLQGHRSIITRTKQLRAFRIERVAARTGWSEAEAEQAMINAWNRSGIGFHEYLNNDFYLLSEEEQDEIHKELQEERERKQAEERRACIDTIMEHKGCSEAEAEELLSDAERRLKISPQTYRRYHFFDIPVSEQGKRHQEIREQLLIRTRFQIEDYDSYLPKIIKETGWTKEETLKKLRRAKENCGASWKDFYGYKFWEIDEEEQKEFFTSEMSKALTEKYDELRSRDIFVNKEVFLEKFKEYLGRNWVVSNRVSVDEFAEAFKNGGKIIYKPSTNGNSGSGIEVFDLADGYEDVYNKISNLPRGIVEEYLIQHEDINRLYPYSVNTIRTVTICHNGSVEIPYAVLRIGVNKSFVDNFTAGGMVADVDLETGKVRTDAVNVHGERFALHPDTQVAVKGFEIPYFQEALEMVRHVGHDVNGYIGWDVAITENGPVLIEGNIDPENKLVQIPYTHERKGRAYVMSKYL